MTSRRSFVVAGLALLASGCATAPRLATGEIWPELEPVETRAGRDGLTIRVTSKGCAVKGDFVFRVDRAGGKAVVAFARRRVEACHGQPGPVDLAFSYEELGLKRGERFVVANPSPHR